MLLKCPYSQVVEFRWLRHSAIWPSIGQTVGPLKPRRARNPARKNKANTKTKTQILMTRSRGNVHFIEMRSLEPLDRIRPPRIRNVSLHHRVREEMPGGDLRFQSRLARLYWINLEIYACTSKKLAPGPGSFGKSGSVGIGSSSSSSGSCCPNRHLGGASPPSKVASAS